MGPAFVALYSFGFYKEGVYFEKDCSNWELDHQVMLYGYGTTDEGNTRARQVQFGSRRSRVTLRGICSTAGRGL